MKKLTAIILICMLIMVGCGDSDSTGNKALDGELELESNQSLVIAQVSAIYGNEITLAIAEKVDDTTTKNANTEQTSGDGSQASTNESADATTATADSTGTTEAVEASSNEVANTSDTAIGSEATTQGNVTAGEESSSSDAMPTDEAAPSGEEMPSGGEAPSGGDMPTGGDENVDSEDSDKEQTQTQVTRYTLTGEEMTATIPVGTPVTTLLGTVTTFSRIAVENTLQIVTEKNSAGEDVIVAIYIVG